MAPATGKKVVAGEESAGGSREQTLQEIRLLTQFSSGAVSDIGTPRGGNFLQQHENAAEGDTDVDSEQVEKFPTSCKVLGEDENEETQLPLSLIHISEPTRPY